MRRRNVLIATVVLAATLAPVPAWGFWTGSATVSATARAGALAAPTVTSAISGGDVKITVTGAPTTAPVPTSYRVDRIAPADEAMSGVCTITASAGLGTCLDEAPVPGETNTYKVVGIVGSWSALDAASPTTSTAVTGNRSFVVDAPATVTAGTSFTVKITARRGSFLDWLYNGTKELDWSGALAGANGTLYVLPDTANFFLGYAEVQVTLVRAGATTLTVSDGNNASRFGTDPITVVAGAATKLAWSGVTRTTDGTVVCDLITCNGVALGNNGGITGTVVMTDVAGNATGTGASGWTISFATIASPDTGTFTAGGGSGATRTFAVPASGSVPFTYVHNGTANWTDKVTVTATKSGSPATSLTATLNKTTS